MADSLTGTLSNSNLKLSGTLSSTGTILSGNLSSTGLNLSGSLSSLGIRGYSAYELAVQNGCTLSEFEWLESLKGKGIESVELLSKVDITASYATKSDITDLQSTFQDGVDSVYNKIVSAGTTPSSKSLSDVVTGIGTLSTNRYNAGVSATKVGTATAAQVLTGYTFTNSSSVGASGSMTNNGAVSSSLNCGGSYTVPAGYHNGSGKITANSLASQTGVQSGKTAITASQVLTGYEGWVNGSRITGSMPTGSITNNTSGGTSSGTINRGSQIKIGAGYYASDLYYTAQADAHSSYTPSSDYFTTTSNSLGSITANAYATSTYYIKSGSATTPTASGASTSTSLSGTTLTVARSVTPTISSGWVASGTAGTVTITGTVPTQTKTVTPTTSEQTITPDDGQLLSSVTVEAAQAPVNLSINDDTIADNTWSIATEVSTTDIGVGAELETGKLYFVYEE